MVRHRVRIRFRKEGDLRLVGHRDLLRLLERALRRAKLPVSLSMGFNPRPRMSFPLALALGIAGRREVMDLELAEELSPQDLRERLAAELPPGLEIVSLEPLSERRKSRAIAVRYELALPQERLAAAEAKVAEFLAQPECPVWRERSGKRRSLDLRAFVLDLGLRDGGLHLHLRVTPQAAARPEEVLAVLGLRDLLDQGSFLVRTDVELDELPTLPPEQPMAPA